MEKVICFNCSKELYRMKYDLSSRNFCSRSCFVSHNNRIKPKRVKKLKLCFSCNTEINNRRKYCQNCKPTIELTKSMTLGDYHKLLSLKGKHQSWKNTHVCQFNRYWNKELTLKPCKFCNYARHVELAHIKPISSFDEETTLGKVNHPDNNLPLCRNHHWEFDNGYLVLLKGILVTKY